jgi:hypothetical protein
VPGWIWARAAVLDDRHREPSIVCTTRRTFGHEVRGGARDEKIGHAITAQPFKQRRPKKRIDPLLVKDKVPGLRRDLGMKLSAPLPANSDLVLSRLRDPRRNTENVPIILAISEPDIDNGQPLARAVAITFFRLARRSRSATIFARPPAPTFPLGSTRSFCTSQTSNAVSAIFISLISFLAPCRRRFGGDLA